MTDIIDLLKDDHKEVKDILTQLIADEEPEDCDELFERLYASLKLHAQFEEDEVYPLLLKGEGRERALQAYEEHRQAITLLDAIHEIDEDDDTCDAKLKVLSEDLNHHMTEEENELLPRLKQAVTADLLQRLGRTYQELKDVAADERDEYEDEDEDADADEDADVWDIDANAEEKTRELSSAKADWESRMR